MAAEENARKDTTSPQDAADALRRNAEEFIDKLSSATAGSISNGDTAALLHELAVHQTELEMQNEELRTAQLALDDQREKYFDLFDLAPVGYVTLSDKGIVTTANLTAASLLGLQRELLVGQPFNSFVYSEDRDTFYLFLRSLEKADESPVCELQFQRVVAGAEPSHFWVRVLGRRSVAADGGIPQTWITFSDIDESVEDREALQQSEMRFASLFEQAPMGYQSLDEDGRFLAVNEMWLETLGYTRDEVLGAWFGDFLAPEFVDGFRERFPKFKTRGAIHSEFEMMHKDGSRRTIAFEGRIGHNPDGSFQKTHCILADITERKRAGEVLAESEDKYRFLFERSAVAQSMTSIAGEMSVNPAFCEMLGYTQEELADSTTWMSLTHPDDLAENQRILEAMLAGDQDSARFEKRYFRKDGSVIWVDVGASLRRTPEGAPLYFLSTMLDVTERKLAEEALRESEAGLAKAQHFARIGSWTWDIKTNRLDWSAEMFNIFGIDRDTFTGSLADVVAGAVHPDDRAEVERSNLSVINDANPDAIEYRVIWPDQSVHTVWGKAGELLLDEEGNPSVLSGTVQDITARKQSEMYAELGRDIVQIVNEQSGPRDSLNRAVAAIRATAGLDAVGIRLQDGEDFPYFAYEGFSQDFLSTENTLIERDAQGEVCRDDDGHVLLDCTCGHVISGSVDPFNPFLTPGGSFWTNDSQSLLDLPADEDPRHRPRNRCMDEGFAAIALVPIQANGRIIGLIHLAGHGESRFTSDAIERLEGIAAQIGSALIRKQAEEALRKRTEELERSNDELQRFAYVASHDLREPLRMVTSYTQLLKKRYVGQLDADADDFIGYAVDGAARMESLIQDLLAYSRVGSQGREFRVTDLGAVLEGTLKGLEVAIAEGDATVTSDVMPTVVCDSSQVGQLFQNLVTNAMKFHRDEPMRIHIGAKRVGDEWVLSVKDNGLGIDAEYFERIFVIFQRLQARNEYEGSGMGLAICKRIVEHHGGRIWVESVLGEGSTFFFSLPA